MPFFTTGILSEKVPTLYGKAFMLSKGTWTFMGSTLNVW